MRTARALQLDNSKLCARMDHIAYRASRRGRGNLPDELDAMWKSLLDGRSRLRELCQEMSAMAGRAMAAAPVEIVVTDERIVSDLTAFTDRINALDAARRELEFSPPPDPPTTSGAGQPNLLQLLSSRAPDLVQPAVALLTESRQRKDEANRSITRWKEQVEQLPAETPATDRDRFTATRREQWAAMQQYVARIHQAEEAVLRAARNLSPLPPPVPPPPKEYERGSVEAAEGMINALKEMNRRSET